MCDPTTIERQAAQWLVRRDADDWTSADAAVLADWIEASFAHRVAFLRLEHTWDQTERLRALGSDPAPAARLYPGSAVLVAHTAEPPVSRPAHHIPTSGGRWKYAMTAALAIVSIAMLGLAGWQARGEHHATYASGIGQVQTLTLADGSHTTLGSDSRIEVHIGRQHRDVELLRGEAIFDVVHDPAKPFIVHAGARHVTAVGTRFSVRRDVSALRVLVTEGRVRLEADPDPDGRVLPVSLLPAGSVAWADGDGVRIESMQPDAVDRRLQWRHGYLDFEDATLAEIISEFNRYHVRKLELADAEVGKLRIGGNFRWSDLDGFVRLLEQGLPVRAERQADRIRLHSP